MVSEYSQLSGVGKSKWAIFIIFLLHSFILSAPKWHSHGKIELNRRFIKPESWHLLIIVYTNNWGFIVLLSFNYKECTCLEKLIHQIDRDGWWLMVDGCIHRWLLFMILLTNITVKCQLVFVLTQENVSS